MKDNQAKYPQLRFKGFTDPWEQHKLGEVVEMFNGDRGINYPKNNDLVPEGVPFINAGDLQNGQVNLESCKKISKEKFNQLSGAKIRRGDILYCLRGTIGKNALVEFDEGTVASSLVDIRPKNIDRMYLFIILNSNIEYRQRLLNDEGAAQPNLSVRNLSKFYIPVPQTKEQHKISVFFKSFNELLTLHQRKLAKLKELKQGYLQKLFPKNGSKFPQLRFSGFADAWEQRKLGEIVEINSGRDYKKLGRGKIPVFGTGGYMLSVNGKLSDRDSVGIGRKGSIDKPQFLSAPFWTVDTLFFMTPKNKNDAKFIFDLSQLIQWKKYDESTGVPSLSKSTISNIPITVTKEDEQNKVSTLFELVDKIIAANQRKVEKLKELKKGYMQKMFC